MGRLVGPSPQFRQLPSPPYRAVSLWPSLVNTFDAGGITTGANPIKPVVDRWFPVFASLTVTGHPTPRDKSLIPPRPIRHRSDSAYEHRNAAGYFGSCRET